MIRRARNWLISAGLLALVMSIGLGNGTHGNHTEFASGFLLGMSLVFIIAGTVQRSRGSSD